MNITISGNGVKENKVAFDKLLDKWNELFTREGLFEEMEFVETESDGTVSFTNEDSELSFYRTEADKASRIDFMISGEKLGSALNYIVGMKFLHDKDGSERKKLEEPSRNAVIVTEIVYEIYSEKRISFVFSKFTDSNDVLLRVEFSDDSSDTELEAKVTAVSEENSEITLRALFAALDKEKIGEHFEEFSQRIEENKKRLHEKIQERTKQEELEKLQPAFDSLDNL